MNDIHFGEVRYIKFIYERIKSLFFKDIFNTYDKWRPVSFANRHR